MQPGSRRMVMSLLHNYMLRTSIDRALISSLPTNLKVGNSLVGGRSAICYSHQQARNIYTTMSFCNGPETSKHTSGRTSASEGSLPLEPPLDDESASKLNELKEGLQTKNEYFEKYKEKLSKLETTSPRELLARLEQLDDSKKDHINRMKTAERAAKKPQGLNDVMHMDSLLNLDRSDIIHLWQEFHRHKEGVMGAVMSGTVYDKMSELASIHKMFVMPLPRTDGYEFFLMQFEENTFHFTPLILYQSHQERAPVSVKLINYTDLKSSKDLVLLRGEYDHKTMRAEDAHFLAVQTNFYYGETNESRQAILDKFTTKPDAFKHMELVDELKKIQETHAQLFEFEPVSKKPE